MKPLMENKGVSPVIATVLLIVVTVMLVSVVAVVAMGLVGRVATPVMVRLSVENYSVGQTDSDYIVVFFQEGSDNLKDAFDGSHHLKNLIIRIDGKLPSELILNGDPSFTERDFTIGDYLQVKLPTGTTLKVGSVISISWKPTGQTLAYIKVS
jgi:flagellin-like protein